ncbi:MAG: DUF5011 domain-containing protein [Pyrinomonadaceae bacterium]|nr:DUF5011 domain-containing protein [Pyrinomonadaceae bacterium]
MKHPSFFSSSLLALTLKGSQSSIRQKPKRVRNSVFVALLAVFLILPALLISSSSASSGPQQSFASKAALTVAGAERQLLDSVTSGKESDRLLPGKYFPVIKQPILPAFLQDPGPETIQTFDEDCTTPKTDFLLGDVVCVKVTGAPGLSIQAFYWSNASNFLVRNTPILATSQDDTFSLPATPTSTIGSFTANNRGDWKITAAGIDDGTARAVATITVHGPTAAADVSVFKFPSTGEPRVNEGTNVAFSISVTNTGPDAATNVTLTDVTPLNMSLVSLVEAGSAGFSCTGSVCTIASLPKDGKATFTATYSVAGVASDTTTAYSATVSSTTADPHSLDNFVLGEITITGVDNTPPACTLGCSQDVTVSATSGQAGANVSFSTPTTSGPVCEPVTCSATSGSFFSIGTTVVTCQAATDDSCSFTVTVTDTQAPVIGACPSPISVNETSSGSGSAVVNYSTPSATDNSGSVSVTCDQPSGSSFSVLGSPHTVTCTASDDAGNTNSCSFAVSVNEVAGNCVLTTVSNVTASSDANQCGTNVTYTPPVSDGTGSCDEPITCDHPSGSFFPVGTTPVMCSSASGGSSSFTVTVEDHTAPVPTVPTLPDVTAQCVVQLNRPTATDACIGGTISATTDDPILYDTPGTYVVHWTYTDSAGNESTQNQNVIVAADTTAPTIVSCATNKTLTAGPSCATMPDLTGEVEASDNCSEVTISQSPAAGTLLSSGNTILTITVTDSAGNPATCTRTITVIDNTPPTIGLVGPNPQVVECHTSYTELGATASDNCGGSFAATSSGGVNVNIPGTYTVTYTASDAAGNAAAPVTRTVNVVDTTSPVITLNGAATITVECHTPFTDPGASAADTCDTSVAVTTSGSVNPNVVGTYTLTYSATDDSGNPATATRTVSVVDSTVPALAHNNLTIFFNNLTLVFGANTFTVNGTTYPFNGVSCTHSGYTFTFNGQTVTITKNGVSLTYTFSGKTLVLWTPTHQYQTVKVADLIDSAVDSCDMSVDRDDVVISQVTSDEPDNMSGGGDGNTTNDIVIAPGCKTVQLRAERNGSGNGRVYTISMRVRDASGNATTVTSKLKIFATSFNVVDSGPQYTVNGTCP